MITIDEDKFGDLIIKITNFDIWFIIRRILKECKVESAGGIESSSAADVPQTFNSCSPHSSDGIERLDKEEVIQIIGHEIGRWLNKGHLSNSLPQKALRKLQLKIMDMKAV